MAADRRRTPYALLTRHFLRQFLENDLISPEADRSQLLAVVALDDKFFFIAMALS